MDRFSANSLGGEAALNGGRSAWEQTSLEDAYNPPQPVVKYRVLYFKYLDD